MIRKCVLGLIASAWLVAGCALFEPAAQPGDEKIDPATGTITKLDHEAAVARIEQQERELAALQAQMLAVTGAAGTPTGTVVGLGLSGLLGALFLRKRAELAEAKQKLLDEMNGRTA